MSGECLMGDAIFGRATPICLRIDVAALVTKHKVESDGKRFPSHDVLLIVILDGLQLAVYNNRKCRRASPETGRAVSGLVAILRATGLFWFAGLYLGVKRPLEGALNLLNGEIHYFELSHSR